MTESRDRKRIMLDIHCAGRECPDCVLKEYSTRHNCDFLDVRKVSDAEVDLALRIVDEDER